MELLGDITGQHMQGKQRPQQQEHLPAPLDEHLELKSNSEFPSQLYLYTSINLNLAFVWELICHNIPIFDCCSMAVYQITGEGLGPRGLHQPVPAQPWLLWAGNWSSCCSTCLTLARAEESKGLCFLGVLSSAYSSLNEFLEWHLISQFAHRGVADLP